MNRIEQAFQHLTKEGRRALIPFITAGDPDLISTQRLLIEMAQRGADIIELGVPFSDPMADGPVIQRASERALANGTKLIDILEMVRRVRREMVKPIVLFSYFNPLLQFGLERLVKTLKEVGIDGLLVTDLSPEEASDFASMLKNNGIEMIFLLAPTSSEQRIAKVAAMAGGFIYAVSRTGITGMQQSLSTAIQPLVARIKAVTSLPVAVGFGISNHEQVAEVWRHADGAVVGSRLVAEIEAVMKQPGVDQDQLILRVGELISSLKGEKLT